MEAKIEEQRNEALRRESRALLAWSNTFLTKRKLKAEVVERDFADGVLLINLVETVFNASIGKFNMTPKLSIHKMENIGKAFEWLEKEVKIVMQGIDPNDLVKKQEKPTITVLWNMMFGSAWRGLGQTSGSQDSAASMKDTLLKWVNGVLAKGGLDMKLQDFWDSWKDGMAFCHIVENLAPGSIDTKSLKASEAEKNLNMAFSTAEAKLGIPPLLNAADMADGKKPDERSVMNYVCMLVSVGQGANQKKEALEELERKAAAAREAERSKLEALQAEMQAKLEAEKKQREDEKKRMEDEVAASMLKFAALGKEKDASEAEKKDLEQAFKNMQDTHTRAQEGFDKERAEFRAIIADLRAQIAKLTGELAAEKNARQNEAKEFQDRITELQADLYASHKEHEDLMDNIRSRLNQKAYQERVVLDDAQASNAFAQLLKDAITNQKSFKDFINSLPNTQGWLNKKRPENKLTGRSTHKRFFTLKGDTLYWGEAEERPFEKSALLDKYLMIDRTGMGEQQTADAVVLADTADQKGTEQKRRRSSVMTYKKGKAVMRLVPRDQKKDSVLELMSLDPGDEKDTEAKPAGGGLLGNVLHKTPKKDATTASVSLPATPAAAEESVHCDDINLWVDTVNTRISLLRYLEGNFNQATLNRGGREVIGFICDPDQTLLKIVDKVADVHMALTHFKEPLQHRKGLCLTFNNIAMSDNDLEVVCDIVESNDTCKSLCFRQNLISAQGAIRLAKALKKNKSITSLEIDYNKIKDEGLIALAEAVYYHRNLEVLSLAGNQIGDSGCAALMTAMMDSQKKTGEPHRMKHLQLSNNLIGDPGAKALARMIRKNETVEMLSLSCNSLTDKGVGYILEVADKHALPLKSLMLARNQLSSKTLIKLAEYLQKVDREVEIDLGENKLITGKGVQAILATHVPIEIQDFRIVKKDKNAALEVELVEEPATAATPAGADTPTL